MSCTTRRLGFCTDVSHTIGLSIDLGIIPPETRRVRIGRLLDGLMYNLHFYHSPQFCNNTNLPAVLGRAFSTSHD
jgi:hypothetical protein